MRRHERVIIELAVAVLRAGVAESDKRRVDTPAVRLALRCLLPYCRERWPLVSYWEGGAGGHEIGRAQTVTAAFNGIVRQLRQSGAWRE
ncbi:hypothetical protein [Sphingomonas hankookensis]|uniref:Transposase n=1 Tax=Sphingomonas hankookensis TaxID=563996 RepID=A0ABR5YDH1_9SPHN|nr:hypothetical protein [Sphingomonas hankookensis]KZE16240.1 hypothetical protein AVT10_12120 [Sphingomonas hankookensis]